MENIYNEENSKVYSKILVQANLFFERINASFIKENHLGENEDFIIGKNITDKKVYTIDSFYNKDTEKYSNNVVLDFKGEDNIFGYAELIKVGYFLLMETDIFEEEDIVIEFNLINKSFSKYYEKLKILLIALGIDFEENEDLVVENAKDFCFSYKVGDNYSKVGTGANHENGVYFNLDIDKIVENAVDYQNYDSNYVYAYLIAVSEEEKMHAIEVLDAQRGNYRKVFMFTKNVSLQEQMQIANDSMCDYIIKFEEENLQKGLVTLIETISNEEELIDIEDIENYMLNDF